MSRTYFFGRTSSGLAELNGLSSSQIGSHLSCRLDALYSLDTSYPFEINRKRLPTHLGSEDISERHCLESNLIVLGLRAAIGGDASSDTN